MFDKVAALYELMQAGKQFKDSGTWANRANLQAILAALITAGVALAKAFDYPIEVAGTDVQSIALGLATLFVTVSNVLHIGSNPSASVVPGKSQP